MKYDCVLPPAISATSESGRPYRQCMCFNLCWTSGRTATETFIKKTCFWRGNSTSHHLINFHSLNMVWYMLRMLDIQVVHLWGKCTEGNHWVKLWTTIPAQIFCSVYGEVYGKNDLRSNTLDVGVSTTTLHLLCLCRNFWCVEAWLLFAPSILLRPSTSWFSSFSETWSWHWWEDISTIQVQLQVTPVEFQMISAVV